MRRRRRGCLRASRGTIASHFGERIDSTPVDNDVSQM